MLEFNIKNQTISCVDRFNPATDSVDYLTAKFNFITDDWDGKAKKALFRSGTVSYEAAISASGVCKVPFEVLVSPENKFSALSGGCIKIYVSVVGTLNTVTIPTKECRVEIGVSGLAEALNGAEPTPSIYEQFVSTIQADNDSTVAEIKADNDETRAEVEALTERAETAKTSAEQSAASMKNDYANALKGKASGEVVRVDDVSPVEHNPVVKVKSKNLIPYPYFSKDALNVDGITYAIDNDGKLTIGGTNEKGTNWYLARNFNLEKGAYAFSYSGSLSGVNILLYCPSKKILVAGLTEHINAVPFVVDETMPDCNIYINIDKVGTTVSGSFYVQLEKGDTATEYTPYIDPSTVTLTRCGKNLVDVRKNYTETVSGVTFTFDDKGKCMLSGTNEKSEWIYAYAILNVGMTIRAGTTVTLSGVPANDMKYCIRIFTNTKIGNTLGGLQGDFYEPKTITLTEDTYIESMLIRVASGVSLNGVIITPLLEIGNTVSDYEPYNATHYTPSVDGTCDIVTVSPTMTLLTDTAGVTVDLEYNRDINAVIADLYNKLG